MRIQPTGHRILIRLDKVEEKHSSTIIKVAKTVEKEQAGTQFGVVVDIGPLAWGDMGEGEPWAAVGDRVVTARYAGAQFDYDDEELKRYRIINDDEIIGVVK